MQNNSTQAMPSKVTSQFQRPSKATHKFDFTGFCARYLAGGVALRQSRQVSRQRLALVSARIPRIDQAATQLAYQLSSYQTAVAKVAQSEKLTLDLLQQINQMLSSESGYGGKIRNVQNWVSGKTAQSDAYLPPTAQQVPQLLAELLDYANNSDDAPQQKAINCYSRLIHIHPFFDGNGRACRALLDGMLTKANDGAFVNPLMFRFQQVKMGHFDLTNGAPASEPFWQQALDWGAKAADDLSNMNIVGRQQISAKIGIESLNSTERQLLDLIWRQPVVTPLLVQHQLSVSQPKAVKALQRLNDLAILTKRRLSQPHNYVFYDCPVVFDTWQQMESRLFNHLNGQSN